MASKGAKKTQSSNRAGSATNKEAASIAASVGAADGRKAQRFVIWPEWSDADINAEKWDAAHKGKEKEKGKSPVVQHFFDDPEGKIEMPPSARVDHWKRPQEYIAEKTPTVVDADGMTKFDLLTPNEHAHESELLRWITSQINALWHISKVKMPPEGVDPGVPTEGEWAFMWRPWEHIYAINKITGKTPNMPAYNPHGKYAVKLYWMGCWRKVIIDDTLPFDDDGHLLLPATRLEHELWPMLLAKALIKVASLDYNGGSTACEFGDFSVINCLTGWLPETIPLQYGHLHEIWKLLQSSLPEWKLPELPAEKKEGDDENKDPNSQDINDDKTDKESTSQKPDQKSKDGKDKGKEKEKGKDDKKDKGKDKKDDKTKEKSVILEDMPIPDHPEIVVFAAYSGPPKYPPRVSLLGEMADASERLRQSGLSHMYPHPVLLKQTRACPLEPPPPPEKVPAWKLIRPKKKKATPSDEPIEPVKEKPIQCVEITSPFINYRVSPVPIPTDTHRPKSSLERGGTRPATASVVAIEETDEDLAEIEVEQPKEETPKQDNRAQEESPGQGEKPPTPSKSRKRLSASPSKSNAGEEKRATTPNRKKSATSRDRVDSRSSADLKGRGGLAPGASPSVGDVVQPTPTSESAQPAEEGDASQAEGDRSPATPANPPAKVQQNIWMDFEDFCKCFKTLYIFHKPHTYPCVTKYSDLKSAAPATKEKKSAPNTAAGPSDERTSHYLFVDNLKPTEIVVSFSALCRWNEPPAAPTKEESKLNMKVKDRDSKAEALTAESISVIEGAPEPRPQEPVQPGLLVAEPYSWKSLVTGQPILRLRSTATRAAVLSLPAGRHLLRFHMQALLGYHVHFCSTVKFVFGDEDSVMTKLTEESCRFIDNATQVMVGLGKCIANFHDGEAFKLSYDEFCDAHCPYRHDRSMNKTYHFGLFNEAFYSQLRKSLAEPQLLTPEMASAWRSLFFDCTSKNILGLSLGSRPATGVTSDRGSAKGKATTKRREQAEANKAPDVWANREPTPEEHVAAIAIQKWIRGFLVRKIKAGRAPGSEENGRAQEQLQKAWQVLEPQMEAIGLAVFRQIFKTDPELMPKYPFYEDEWNKVAFSDYQGAYPDQAPNTWFVVFREVFHVAEEMLCVPKLTFGPGPTCMLRVVNNDTGEEIPRVFQKVAPYVYKRNKRGYTFTAEARTLDQPLQAGRWKMRLIGSLSPLPAPTRGEVNSSFHSRELRDYYLPNDKNIIFRYSVRVTEDHVTSLQMTTSKPDVYVKLSVLDHDEVLISTVGKGHVVLPAFIFLKDPGSEEEPKRSSSRTSVRGAKPHKYIIQAVVLRNSWPISESAWNFVQVLKELEKNELKVAFKDAPPADAGPAPRSEKMTSAASNKGKDKDKGGKGKDKGAKEKGGDRGSRPPSQQFDFTKPNWTLRIVSDASNAEEIEVRKDTERADEIRAMKKAWEDAEPGRAAKAMQSRLEYLKTHMVKLHSEEEEEPAESSEVPADGAVSPTLDGLDNEPLLLEPPPPPQPKEVLQEIDITPFIRSSGGMPRLRDEAEVERQLVEKQQEIAEYRAYRQAVEAQRDQDRLNRNQAKVHQLEVAELLQSTLDSARDTINQPREAFRQRFLDAERRRLEEVASVEAALRADQEKAVSPKGRKSPGKKSAGKKKK